jgi:hypothetical protein
MMESADWLKEELKNNNPVTKNRYVSGPCIDCDFWRQEDEEDDVGICKNKISWCFDNSFREDFPGCGYWKEKK